MSQDLDGRLGHVFIVVRRARLSEILDHPRLLLAGFNVPLRRNTGKSAKHSKSVVRSSAAAVEDRTIWIRVAGHDTFEVQSNRAIHGPPECFICFYAAIE